LSANTVAKLILLLSLLPLVACVLGAEEAVTFPTYKEGEASFPSLVTVFPVFSGSGNYGLIASGDTLYHMELRHGRIHGKTAAGGQITAIEAGTGLLSYAVCGDQLLRIDGFEITVSTAMAAEGISLAVCGDQPVVLLEDGSLVLYKGTDLSVIAVHAPVNPELTCIEGFNGMLTAGCADGTMITFSIPSFAELASEKVNGSLVFMSGAGQDNLIFSTDVWNEVAVCSPSDLMIQIMFTFPETPSSAAADSDVSCVYAVCPSYGIQVCLENGEIAWKTKEYGENPLVVLSQDCEYALIASGNSVTLLAK